MEWSSNEMGVPERKGGRSGGPNRSVCDLPGRELLHCRVDQTRLLFSCFCFDDTSLFQQPLMNYIKPASVGAVWYVLQ